MQAQVRRNNAMSMLLLAAFPAILLAAVWLFFLVADVMASASYGERGEVVYSADYAAVNAAFAHYAPWVAGAVAVWFAAAYFFNASMVAAATGAVPLERRDNPRVYNIVENLCMACNMDMPRVNIVDDPGLNAYASGIGRGSYAVTLTTGIIDRLDDRELAGVVAHELTHIRNRDTRLLITSIVFVGIVSTVMSAIVHMIYHAALGGSGRDRDRKGGAGVLAAMAAALACAAVAYVFVLLTRFAISRKREYMADAGGAELCGDPLALASALRKISEDPGLAGVGREDIAQLFIEHPGADGGGMADIIGTLFSTHPDIRERIRILEQF